MWTSLNTNLIKRFTQNSILNLYLGYNPSIFSFGEIKICVITWNKDYRSNRRETFVETDSNVVQNWLQKVVRLSLAFMRVKIP